MVKKLKYLLFLFPLLIPFNVKANTAMPSPTSFQLQNYDNTSSSYGVREVGWYNVVSYGANTNYGGTYGLADEYVTRWNIWYSNSNICLNKSATLYITINSYYSPFNTSQAPIMTYTSFLRAYNGTTDYTCSLNQSLNEGKTTTWTCNIIGTQNLLLHLETDMPSDTVYGFSVGTDSNYVCDTTADVSSSINNSTQNIINNENQNTQNIINNQNENTQDIIDNQNENTNKQIESQLSCRNSNNYRMVYDGYLTSSGGTASSTGTSTSDFISIPTKIIPLTTGSTRRLCFYSSRSTNGFISCITNSDMTVDTPLDIPTNAKYLRFTKLNTTNQPMYNFCTNGNEALMEEITSDALPNTNEDIDDMNDMVASDTPISDLITMPLTLINAYINGVNSSCSPVNLGNLYGTDLILPCINLQQRLGASLWNTIDIFFSIFMCYNIGMLFITAFDGLTSLRDDFEGLYQPRHADIGYKPKHGG